VRNIIAVAYIHCTLFSLNHIFGSTLTQLLTNLIFYSADMSSTAFIEPLPVIDFVTQLLNRDVSARPLSDADRVKVRFVN
jgi:hypothetical protein